MIVIAALGKQMQENEPSKVILENRCRRVNHPRLSSTMVGVRTAWDYVRPSLKRKRETERKKERSDMALLHKFYLRELSAERELPLFNIIFKNYFAMFSSV